MNGLLWFLAFFLLPRKWVYPAYMRSKTWKRRRARIVARDAFKCCTCGTYARLEVHHKSYALAGIEPGFHLMTLCRDCHVSIHNAIRRGFFIVSLLLFICPFALQAQCDGRFLFYNHGGYFGAGYDCYTCSYNLLAIAAIQESASGRYAMIRFALWDSTGARMNPQSSLSGSIPMGQIYDQNILWYGVPFPFWMGQTSSSWYFGSLRYVLVAGASYHTSCANAGPITVRLQATTHNAAGGDTCTYDSTFLFPHCLPLALDETPTPEPIELPEPQEVDRWDVPYLGLRVLLMWDGERYTTQKQKVIR